MKLETDEKEILDSVERGEWRSARAPKRVLSRYSRSAKATFKKDRRLNIRISTRESGGDPEARTRGGTSLSNLDRELVAQVRRRAAPRGVAMGRLVGYFG